MALEYERKLLDFIRERAVDCEHVVFAQSTHSVAEAAAAAGVRPEDFIKSICLISKDGRVAVAIVKGEDRADRQAAQRLLNIGKLSIASPADMLERTGYPAGGTPPFGFEAEFVVDERVLECAAVYAGGGSPRSLVRIAPTEMLRVNGGRVAQVRATAAA